MMVKQDCNDCEFLSIIEKDQNDLRKLGYDYTPHICNKYDKRVLHFPYQQPFIHPCEECEKEENREKKSAKEKE